MSEEDTVKIEAELPLHSSVIKEFTEILKTGKTVEVEMYDFKRDGERRKKFLFRMRLL